MNNYCVYVHTNKINGKKYVGLTSQDPERRWKHGYGYKGSTYFYNAIQKYGWNSFTHEIIAANLSKKEAQDMESKLILEYKTQDENFGYNLESGGSAPQHSDATIEKLRLLNKGRIVSEETKEKMREADKLRPIHKHTEEAKTKISAAKIGHKVSDETREKLRKAFSQKVICVEMNKIFNSMKEAAEYFGLSKCTISAVIKGRNKTAGGYHWKLIND